MDDLERYANEKLEKNIEAFSRSEMNLWWNAHFENQSLLILVNSKVFEESIHLIPTLSKKWMTLPSAELLNYLIDHYKAAVSLKEIYESNDRLVKGWNQCHGHRADFLGLKGRIFDHYISALKLPQVAETYMIAGGDGDQGISSFFESITTTVGTLLNRDKAKSIKEKSKKIRRIFHEKFPRDEALRILFEEECESASERHKEFLSSYSILHNELKHQSQAQWNFYLSQKSMVGNLLLEKKIKELSVRDTILSEKLGIGSLHHISLKIIDMTTHLSLLRDQYVRDRNINKKEEIEDYLEAIQEQVTLLEKVHKVNLSPAMVDLMNLAQETKKEIL